MIIREDVEMVRTHGCGHLAKCATRPHTDPLSHRMVVVSSDQVSRIFANPVDTGHGIRCIIHHISKEKTGIKRLVDCRQSGPVGVDIGKQQDSHGSQCGRFAATTHTKNWEPRPH